MEGFGLKGFRGSGSGLWAQDLGLSGFRGYTVHRPKP